MVMSIRIGCCAEDRFPETCTDVADWAAAAALARIVDAVWYSSPFDVGTGVGPSMIPEDSVGDPEAGGWLVELHDVRTATASTVTTAPTPGERVRPGSRLTPQSATTATSLPDDPPDDCGCSNLTGGPGSAFPAWHFGADTLDP
jgi:hypothetical protein